MTSIDSWFLQNLVCPKDKLSLELSENNLICANGHVYPVVEGIPIMLPNDITHTHIGVSRKTFDLVKSATFKSPDPLLGENEEVDRFVQKEIAGSNSNLYRASIGKLKEYPIPQLPLPDGNNKYLLDVGCNWGRWCIAASNKGYQPVGIDPSLEGIMAANRVAKQLGKTIKYVVADSRYMPFRDNFFDTVYSYSVLQHFAKENVKASLVEINRVLKSGGQSKIQMLNTYGLRGLLVQIRRGFRKATDFQTRYWTPADLQKTFDGLIGESKLVVASFFTQGQPSDKNLFLWRHRLIVNISELLKLIKITALVNLADNVFVISTKK